MKSNPAGRATADGSTSGRTGQAGTKSGGCRRREVRRHKSPGREACRHRISGWTAFCITRKRQASPTTIWRVPVGGGEETQVVDGLSYRINFVVADRGLYFVAVGDTGDQPSIDFLDFATGKRATLVRLDKPYWFGMTLSPDERSLVFPLVDSAGSNLMLVDRFR